MSSFCSTLLPRSHCPTRTPPLFTLPLLLEFLRSAPSAKRKMANPFLLFLPIASCFLQIWTSDVLFYESFDEPFDGRWIVSRKGDYGERVYEPVKAQKIHVVREMKIQRNIMTTSKDRQDPTTTTVRVNLLKELREILHQTGGWHRKPSHDDVAVPPFAEWDENDPASGEKYTGIFKLIAENRRTPGTPYQPPEPNIQPETTTEAQGIEVCMIPSADRIKEAE
ncbi:uncharacterized protein LOC121992202 isoform X2 [Zingiber officinale]|uniref:uncharacterized protein LOC121992202 isoform X2 n=1 Tax=Zingiber officinale TaxID=94328 RepID=UPI001C4C35F9|nr:uncharacterized protein LOC121992202 isoform X2 [Zingiber officinale]XP_042402341.1 uncharacterized protein LOC121992202 isoform X2 [Zingiber officinale]